MKNSIGRLMTLAVLPAFIFTLQACEKDIAVSGTISGDSIIHKGDSAEVVVYLEGTPPFGIKISGGTSTYEYVGIETSPFTVKFAPEVTTTYLLDIVGCYYRQTAKGKGSATITVLL